MFPLLMVSIALNVVSPTSTQWRVLEAEETLMRRVNQTRQANGLDPLVTLPVLRTASRRHAAEMRAEGRIFHTPSLHARIKGFTALGEDVGVAASADEAFIYFMQSARHKAVILDPQFTHGGAGVAIRDGTYYAVLTFGAR